MKLLYIDPGTGSMLITIILGMIGAAIYGLRRFFVKLRVKMSVGKAEVAENNKQSVVIFTDSKRYWNVFEPICNELEKRGIDVHYMTASDDDPALQEKYDHIQCEFIGAGNRAFARLNILEAKIVLSSTPSLEVFQWKRSRGVEWYVHVAHGANDPVMYRMFGLDYYDAVLISGEYQIEQLRKLEEMRGLPAKELELVGLPHMDAMKARLEAAEASGDRIADKKQKTVLLAPSWTINSIFNRYGGAVIDALLETDCHIIVRPHPQSFISEKEMIEKLMADYPASDQLEWNRDNDNFEVLRRSDILISDFSGVIFEFALVYDKPIIYADTSYDRGPLDCWWLEDELWTFATLPKIGAQLTRENMSGIGALIDRELHDESRREAREQARRETWVHIGESAVRTVDYLQKKLQELENNGSDKGERAAQ